MYEIFIEFFISSLLFIQQKWNTVSIAVMFRPPHLVKPPSYHILISRNFEQREEEELLGRDELKDYMVNEQKHFHPEVQRTSIQRP